MADSTLASILSGNDPLSPEMLDALHAEQARAMVADSSNWNNTGWAGAIGRTLAGFLAPGASSTLSNIVAQRQAAQPDQARLLAQPDPYQALADNPDAYSPLARAMVLNGANPDSVADARLKAAQGAMYQAKANFAQQQGGQAPPMYLNGVNALGAVGQPAAPSGGTGGSGNWETVHNNFGGLRIPGSTVGPNAGGFQAFASPEDGIAAIGHQLDRYASGATTGKPLTTLRQIVSTWAPPNQNDTQTLIARASKVTGFDPDAPLNISDPAVKAKLIEATIRNEQGGALPVDPSLIQKVAAGGAAQPAMAVGGAMLPGQGGNFMGPSGAALAATRSPGIAADDNGKPYTPPDGATAQMSPAVAQLAQAGQSQPATPQAAQPMPPGVAQLAQAGQPQMNPAYIDYAQKQARAAAVLGEQAPGFIAKAAELPLAGPTASAEANARNASDLQFKPQIAGQTKAAELPSVNAAEQFRAQQEIGINRAKQQDISERTPTTIMLNGREVPVTQQQYADIVNRLGVPGVLPGNGPQQATSGPPSNRVAAGGALPGVAGTSVPNSTSPQDAPNAPQGQQPPAVTMGKPYFTPEQSKLSEAYGEQGAEIVKAAQKAPDVLGKVQVMRTAAQYFTPGATADQRLSGARYISDIAPRLGFNVTPEFSRMVASGEAINKEGGQLVAELVRSMGSREAYAVWNQVRSFMPSVSMSNGGYGVIMNTIEQGAKRDADLGQFQDQWLGDPAHQGSLVGMVNAFNKAHPIETYSSRVMPIPTDFAKGNFVPGAVYVNKSGSTAIRTPDGHWQATE